LSYQGLHLVKDAADVLLDSSLGEAQKAIATAGRDRADYYAFV
jgi:hypothetical protein